MNVRDFLNPRSMFTPGFAGGVIMIITNTLWITFAIPQKWAALILSILLVYLTLKKYSVSFIEKIIYFIFNVLILFSLAINTNLAGGALTSGSSYTSKMNSLNSNQSVIRSPSSVITAASYDSLINKTNINQFHSNKILGSSIYGRINGIDQMSHTENITKENQQSKFKSFRSFFDPWF